MPTHSATTCQKQRASRSTQDAINSGHKVAHFPEQEKVQLSVITTVQHYSLKVDKAGAHTDEAVHLKGLLSTIKLK